MKRNRVSIALVLALGVLTLLAGCGGPPSVSVFDPPELVADEIAAVHFSALAGEWQRLRDASASEVEQIVSSYATAADFDDTLGTTHPARIEVVLQSGDSVVIGGGDAPFQTVSAGRRSWNIASTKLDQLLRQIAAEGQLGPSATADAEPRYAAAEAVLRRYWVLVSSGQYVEAQALLCDDHGTLYRDPALESVTDVKIRLTATGHRFASGIVRWKNYADLCQFQVVYVSHVESLSGEPPGCRIRFVVLGKLTPQSEWCVLGVLTSP